MSTNFKYTIALIMLAAAIVVLVPPFFQGFLCGTLGTLSYYLGRGDRE